MLPRDAFDEVADPALLLLLRVGQQEQLFGRGHVVVHWRGDSKRLEPLPGVFREVLGRVSVLTLAGHDDFLLPVQVVLVALGVAAAALEGGRGLEDVPQGAGADLAAGREVVEGGDELVALVADVRGPVAERRGLHHDLLIAFDLAFVRVQDLRKNNGRR